MIYLNYTLMYRLGKNIIAIIVAIVFKIIKE